MTDEPNDPWGSLADELGVQPGQQPAPLPPPSAASPPAAKQRIQLPSTAAPPKKSSSDWNALAGELGLEVPPEPETKPPAHDPVAELLGFPPPSAFPPQPGEKGSHDQDEAYREQYEDERDRPANRTRRHDEENQQRSRDLYDDTKPVYDDTKPADFDERDEAGGFRDRPLADEERSYRPSRRRGGRGRGQGERGGEGRGNRYGNQPRERRPYHDQHEPQADRPFDEEAAADQASLGGESTAKSTDEHQQRAQDDQSQKRRRRRRGRGGRRDRPEQRSPDHREESSQPAAEEIPFLEMISDEELAGDSEVHSSDFAATDAHFDAEPSEHDDQIPSESARTTAEIDELDEHDEAALADPDENHSGKTSVRDILTWKEAIGMIIEGNLQARAHAPQSSQHSRGPRGRGRGRGRGGQRR